VSDVQRRIVGVAGVEGAVGFLTPTPAIRSWPVRPIPDRLDYPLPVAVEYHSANGNAEPNQPRRFLVSPG
jgi:hypothetical protein